MANRKVVAPTRNGEGAALCKATPSIAQLGGIEHRKPTEPLFGAQDEARTCERMARRYALAALTLGGGLALQHVALSRFYSDRAASLIMGAGQ